MSNNAAAMQPGQTAATEKPSSMFNLLNDNDITPLPPPSAPPVIDEEKAYNNKQPEYSNPPPSYENANSGATNGPVTVLNSESPAPEPLSKFQKRRRYQLFGLVGSGFVVIVLSILLGGLIRRHSTEWKSVEDGKVVEVSDVEIERYDYCKKDDVRPLDPDSVAECELVYVCNFEFKYKFSVDGVDYFGRSTEETDYEEMDCYADMVEDQEDFANSTIEIYYNADDPDDNDYYEQFDGKAAGGLLIVVGVIGGVFMIITGVTMLLFGKCCCIE